MVKLILHLLIAILNLCSLMKKKTQDFRDFFSSSERWQSMEVPLLTPKTNVLNIQAV